MRVLQVVNDFFPDTGGVQRFVLELSKALCRRGVEVKVISASRGVNGPNATVDGVPVEYAGHLFKIGEALISPNLVFRAIAEKTDVVHTHIPFPWSSDWATITGKLRRRPVILTWHNDAAGSGWKRLVTGAYNLTMHRLTLSLTDRIVTVTPNRAEFSRILRRFQKKTVHIGEGVDSSRFQPMSLPTDGVTVGFLALLRATHRYKGLDVLLQAAQMLRERGIVIKVKIGGDGDLQRYYRNLARELGLGDQVEFPGFLAEDELVDFYNSLDVFVLPSWDHRFEGFGLVALEAAACARPVITTTAAGVAAIILESGCGIVDPPNDPGALASSIAKILGDAVLKSDMGRRGRELAERLSWDKIAEEYENLYQDVSSGPQRGR